MGKTADTIRSSLWIWEKSCGELAIKPLWRMEGVVDQAMRKRVFSLKDATVGFGQKNLYCLISVITVGQINCFSIPKSPLLKRWKHFSVSDATRVYHWNLWDVVILQLLGTIWNIQDEKKKQLEWFESKKTTKQHRCELWWCSQRFCVGGISLATQYLFPHKH